MRSWPSISGGRTIRPSHITTLQDAVDEIEGGEVELPLAGIEGALGVAQGTAGNPLYNQARTYINGIDRGIVADGVTNCSPYLADVIDEISESFEDDTGTALALYLPSGPIRLEDTVRLKSGMHMRGQGAQLGKGTRFMWAGDPDEPVFDSDPGDYLSNVLFEDFEIEPHAVIGFPPAFGGGDGFRIYGMGNNSAFRRVMVSRLTGHGMSIGTQGLIPGDHTGYGNVVMDQFFVITCGGYGVKADGYHQVVFNMCDFNGNRGGDYWFLNGVNNQAGVTIIGQWSESNGTAPSSNRVLLEDMNGQQVTFIGWSVMGPSGTVDPNSHVITITDSTARPILIGCQGFGKFTNWIQDNVDGETVPMQSVINYFGSQLDTRYAVIRGVAPGLDMIDIDGTTDQRRFRLATSGTSLSLTSRTDNGTFASTLATIAHATGKWTLPNELELDGALNHDGSTVGFYGTAPIAKQTGVAVDAAGIHAALVALGLISA